MIQILQKRMDDGLTVSNLVFDEFAFMKFNNLTYLSCLPAWKKASENAKEHGTPYGITIITTPNNLDTPAGAYCHQMIEMAAKWVFECFDFSDEELDAFLETNSQNNYFFVQYTYKELGRTDEWLRVMIRECNNDLAKVKREILLEWPFSSDASVLSEEQLDKIHQFIKEPITRLLVDNYIINMYEAPDVNLNYILSCDVSGGLSRDNSVINIIHPEDFRIVGDFVNNKIDTDSFRKLLVTLMTVYFRNALLVVERNSYGLNILQSLMKDPSIEPRMHREDREALGEKKQTNGFTIRQKTKTIAYGVDTNAVTRKQMFDLLPEIVDTEYDKFISPNLYDNLASLEKKKNGKIEHSSSGHDDSLMAYLIFRYAVFHGKCFRDRFGISPIPSRMNVKVQSSSADFAKIASIIENANNSQNTSLMQNPIYNYLLDQQRKINADTDAQLSAFMRVSNLNK